MLVLSRQVNERVIINDDIVVEVVRIQGNEVRLGITAPKGVGVHREEVYLSILAEKERKVIDPEQVK